MPSRLHIVQEKIDNEAIYTGSEDEIIEAANIVISIFRNPPHTDWLMAMSREYRVGEWGIENLLALVGSMGAEARIAGDETFDVVLEEAVLSRQNEIQTQIVQWIYESIEYFYSIKSVQYPVQSH